MGVNRQLRREEHKVHVLGERKAGETIHFPTGAIYGVQKDNSVRRLIKNDGKLFTIQRLSKAEKKAAKRERIKQKLESQNGDQEKI